MGKARCVLMVEGNIFYDDVMVNYEGVICLSVGTHPSSPKTLPPTTMGFGRMGTATALLNQVRCFLHHGSKDAYMAEGNFRSIIKEVMERYLDCGNLKCGFGRIRLFFKYKRWLHGHVPHSQALLDILGRNA